MIFMEVVYPKLAIQTRDVVQGLIQQSKAAGEEMAIDDGFELYKELSEVRRIYLEAFPKREYPVRLEDLFVDFPIRWLQTVDSKVIGWVAAAIQEDHLLFKWPEGKELGDERHTSSVVDIFRSFSQSIEQIKKLDWQDELQYAKFMTIMSKVFGKGLMRYCEELETFFTHEMGKKTPEQEAALSQTKQQKWMSMAKDAWSNKEKVEPFQFAPEVCIFFNPWLARC